MSNFEKVSSLGQQIAEPEETDTGTNFRVSIDSDGVSVPVLLHLKRASRTQQLVVTYNGAVSRSKAPDGVVFQRSSWLDDFSTDVIQISDPSLTEHRRLALGWGQFRKDKWAYDAYVGVISLLRDQFGLAGASATVHYGSSAGGFQALIASGKDKGSRALANNPQVDWSRYVPQFVNSLLRDVFEGDSIDEVRSREPWRLNAFEFYKQIEFVPKVEMMFNAGSAGDFTSQIQPVISELQSMHVLSNTPNISLTFYHHEPSGHNPLSRAATIKAIESHVRAIRTES